MRGKSVVWDHFNCDDEEGQASSPLGGKTRPAAYCSYCNLKYSFPNATKMMRHLLKCSLCPDQTKRKLEQSGFGEFRSDHHTSPLNGCHGDECAAPSMRRSTMASQLYHESDSPRLGVSALSLNSGNPSSTVSLLVKPHQELREGRVSRESSSSETEQQHAMTDQVLASAIFRTDVPFTITENAHWLKLFCHLKPSYLPPTRETITGPLLETEYMATLKSVYSEISKAKSVTVLVQGQRHTRVHPVALGDEANVIVTTPAPIFIGSINIGRRQTPEDIAGSITRAMNKVEPARIVLLVTDLRETVRASWTVLSERFPFTTIAANPLQCLHLFWRNFLDLGSITSMTKQAREVIECKTLLDKHELRLNLPTTSLCGRLCEDGFESMQALEALLLVKDRLHDTAADASGNAEANIKANIEDEKLWNALSLTLTIWRSVQKSMLKLAHEEVRLSDVVVEMTAIDSGIRQALEQSSLPDDEREVITSLFDEIKSICCKSIHHAACLLDPRYCGSCLVDEELSGAIQYIVEWAKVSEMEVGRVLANLAEYRAREGRLWSKQYLWDAASHVAPATWWKGICDTQPLSPVAMCLLNLTVNCDMTSMEPSIRGECLDPDQAQKVFFIRANSELCSQHNDHPESNSVH